MTLTESELEALARRHGAGRIGGTSVLFIDHDEIRACYNRFRKVLPRVQPYFAVKANSLPEIINTVYRDDGSFDVASYPEFLSVARLVKGRTADERKRFVWNNIIYAHPVKDEETLRRLDRYSPLVTFDCADEVDKIKRYAQHAGLVLRIKTPNVGAVCDLSCKFGVEPKEAVELIEYALSKELGVEGISFHVGSQCTNASNYAQALELAKAVFDEVESKFPGRVGDFIRGERKRIVDIGGGFPVQYTENVPAFEAVASLITQEIDCKFPAEKGFEIIAEPGRFVVATSATLVARVTAVKKAGGKMVYTINDGVYHTYSGQLFDHILYDVHAFKHGKPMLSQVNGQTCDGLDIITQSTMLPLLRRGDLVYSRMIGAYSNASSTYFNGFPPAKIVHLNLYRKK